MWVGDLRSGDVFEDYCVISAHQGSGLMRRVGQRVWIQQWAVQTLVRSWDTVLVPLINEFPQTDWYCRLQHSIVHMKAGTQWRLQHASNTMSWLILSYGIGLWHYDSCSPSGAEPAEFSPLRFILVTTTLSSPTQREWDKLVEKLVWTAWESQPHFHTLSQNNPLRD